MWLMCYVADFVPVPLLLITCVTWREFLTQYWSPWPAKLCLVHLCGLTLLVVYFTEFSEVVFKVVTIALSLIQVVSAWIHFDVFLSCLGYCGGIDPFLCLRNRLLRLLGAVLIAPHLVFPFGICGFDVQDRCSCPFSCFASNIMVSTNTAPYNIMTFLNQSRWWLWSLLFSGFWKAILNLTPTCEWWVRNCEQVISCKNL